MSSPVRVPLKTVLLVVSILAFSSCRGFGDGLYVLRFGRSLYPESHLREIPDSDRDEDENQREEVYIPISWDFYLLRQGSARVLVDSGFSEASLPGYTAMFNMEDYAEPATLLERAGVVPSEITDVVLTHSHFDHAGGVFLFGETKTVIHIQRDEWLGFLSSDRDVPLREFLERVDAAGRLHLVDGRFQLYPWIGVDKTGGHTIGSQAAFANIKDRSYVFVGDECYTAKLCREHSVLPETASFSQDANLAFMNRVTGSPDAGQALLLPAHDLETIRDAVPVATQVWKFDR